MSSIWFTDAFPRLDDEFSSLGSSCGGGLMAAKINEIVHIFLEWLLNKEFHYRQHEIFHPKITTAHVYDKCSTHVRHCDEILTETFKNSKKKYRLGSYVTFS